MVGKLKLGTPRNIWIDNFFCLRSKVYSFESNNENINKLRGISKSQSKHI